MKHYIDYLVAVRHWAKLTLNASLLVFCHGEALAAAFTIDPSRSNITLSGSVLGNAFHEQRTGSLTTKFEGMINADVTDSSIVFTGSSLVTAQDSGSWEPKANEETGSDLANFGGKASAGLLGSAVAAVRHTQLDVSSLALPLTRGQFNSGGLLFQFLPTSKGTLDYNVVGFVPLKGSIPLAGIATNRVSAQATLTTSGNLQTLTIPVISDFFFKLVSANDTTLTLTGQIVATRTVGDTGGSTTGIVAFSDDFQRTTLGSDWTVVDDAPASAAPSKWYVQAGTLYQDSNIYKDPGQFGTHIVTGATTWIDYVITARITPTDNDGWGVIVRYQDSANYYRFFTILDSANGGPFMRLEKIVNGTPTTLSELNQAYTENQTYLVAFEALGDRLTVKLDGQQALTTTDSTFARGKAGFCTYAPARLPCSRSGSALPLTRRRPCNWPPRPPAPSSSPRPTRRCEPRQATLMAT